MTVPIDRVVIVAGGIKIELPNGEHYCPDAAAAEICLANLLAGDPPVDHSAP